MVGITPTELPGTWETLSYRYACPELVERDHQGRRSETQYDEQTVLTYVYAVPIRLSLRAGSEFAERDGDHCIAEYDDNGVLQRTYIYGPGVDQPICMIEEAGTYEGTYYYHFDALGSVVALSNSAGNTVQAYDYSVWGQVGAEVVDHPNPYMFTARRFDKETGLCYYRARYYTPEIG